MKSIAWSVMMIVLKYAKEYSKMSRGMLRLVFFLSFFLYSLQLFARTVVISDIDDTLKKSNSTGKAIAQTYHFLRKIPYLEMRDLFKEIKANEKAQQNGIRYYYVSAAYQATFNAQKWLAKHDFPIGRSTLKTFKNKESTYDFKHAVIKDILDQEMRSINYEEGESLHVLMFGDNAQVDALVYNDLTKELNLDSNIYIRDVKAEATFFDSTLEVKRIPGVKYYFSEVELLANPEFSFVSLELKNRTHTSFSNKTLIPNYTLKTLSRRLKSIYSDKDRARTDALKYWNDYYSRY